MLDGILTPMREVNGTISGATQLESGYQNQAQWGGAMLDPCDSRTLVRGQIFTRISQVIASYSMKTISSASYERIIQETMTV